MATEIVTIQINDSFTPEAFTKTLEFVNPLPPGLHSLRWGRTVEDANTILWLLNWDSVKAHEDFTKSTTYSPFVASIVSFCTAPVTIYHTHLLPFPPTILFEAGIIELSAVALKPDAPDVSPTDFSAKRDDFLGLVSKAPGYHCHFQGLKHEDSNIHIMLIGWDSMESRTTAYTDEAISQAHAAMTAFAVPEESSVCNIHLHPQQ